MRKISTISLCILMILCLIGFAGCAQKPPEEDSNITGDANIGLTAEKFTEIMEQKGAFVTDMSEYFPGVLIATDTDTAVFDITADDYLYIVTYFSLGDKNEAETEYNGLLERYAGDEKTYEQTFTEQDYVRYEFVSEQSGCNVIIINGNAVITGESKAGSKDIVDDIFKALGY